MDTGSLYSLVKYITTLAVLSVPTNAFLSCFEYSPVRPRLSTYRSVVLASALLMPRLGLSCISFLFLLPFIGCYYLGFLTPHSQIVVKSAYSR